MAAPLDKPSREFIKEYWEIISPYHPTLTFDQFNEVVRSPFAYLKTQIRGYLFPTIRLKYFGKFTVQKGRAKAMYRNLDKVRAEQKISEREYFKLKQALREFIEDEDTSWGTG